MENCHGLERKRQTGRERKREREREEKMREEKPEANFKNRKR